MRRRPEVVQFEIALPPIQVLAREIEAGHASARLRGAYRKGARVGENVQHLRLVRSRGPQWKFRGHVAGQKTATVVSLVQKQPGGVALGETQFELPPVLPDHEPPGRRFAEEVFRTEFARGPAAHLAD